MGAKCFFGYWDMVQDVTMKLLSQIPEDQLDYKPTPKNMSLKDLAVHMFEMEKVFVGAALKGELTFEDFNSFKRPEIKSVEDLKAFAKAVHDETNEKIVTLPEEELESKMVKTPWGEQSIFVFMSGAYEHLWHHRGQLYVYLHLVGVDEPIGIYSYPGMTVGA
ncbi:MAG: DinB family protein [Firmicutes bacterium]|nr:DinB family protein [Bacillota bacterium]